jgi:hypothetical protein
MLEYMLQHIEAFPGEIPFTGSLMRVTSPYACWLADSTLVDTAHLTSECKNHGKINSEASERSVLPH